MAKKKRQSALILTFTAWEILKKYRGAFGVKKTLSVGLELFDRLSEKERFERVSAAEAADKLMRRTEGEALATHKRPHRTGSKEVG